MQHRILAFWLPCLALALASCGQPSAPAPTETASAAAASVEGVAASPSAPAPDVEGAEAAIRAEKKVIDLVYQPNEPVQWLIGVKGDGSPWFGYAEYICNVLYEHQFPVEGTSVRIVDYRRFMLDGDHHAASLGSVDCATSQHMVP